MAPRSKPTTIILPAEPGIFLAYLTPDGVLDRQIVIGWRFEETDSGLQPQSVIVVGDAVDHERDPVILHPSGHVTDFRASETYEDVSTWMGARGVTPPNAPILPKALSAAVTEPLTEADVAAIAGAVETYDNPRAHIHTGPGMPGERRVLPGQDNPTSPPAAVAQESGEVDLGAMANDPGRVKANDFEDLI